MANALDTETVRLWLRRVERAGQREHDWRERARKVVKRYRDERTRSVNTESRFNILWSNTETLRPALYSARPKPDIRRRWRQDDPVSGAIALALERAAEFTMDTQDFDGTMQRVVLDYLLSGRGTARVRYAPVFEQPDAIRMPLLDVGDGVLRDQFGVEREAAGEEAGQSFAEIELPEELVSEDVQIEYVPWRSLRFSGGEVWSEVWWIAFRHKMTREELREHFGARLANQTRLDAQEGEDREEEPKPERDDERLQVAEVWEIWDRDAREVLFVAEGLQERPLDLRDDPLDLKGFYPIPEPLYSVRTNESTIPVPEYTLYQDQADELDELTARLNAMIDALRVRGLYDAAAPQIAQLLMSGDNDLVPVENWRALTDKGGLDGVIAWMPIDQIAKVVAQLYVQREQLLTTIYQITGISDIQRGDTDPRETKGAQQIKAQFSSLRLKPRQDAVQAYARDLLRLVVEIVAENFSPETITRMTAVPMSPDLLALMRDNGLRDFSIDVETDSTVATDVGVERQQYTEFLSATTQAIQAFAPLVQAGLLPAEAAKQFILFGARKFRVSRELEQALDALGQGQQPQQQQDPRAQAEMLKVQNEARKTKLKELELQLEAQNDEFQRQLESFEARLAARKQAHQERMDIVGARLDASRLAQQRSSA